MPEDAIILPYDPDWRNGIKDADRVLVPYDRYVELWNAVHPDKKIETKAPPAPFALAGRRTRRCLDGEEYLLVTGQLEIDMYSDGFVAIPLGLGGGVLAQAELDGKPARMIVHGLRSVCGSATEYATKCEAASGCTIRHPRSLAGRALRLRQGARTSSTYPCV